MLLQIFETAIWITHCFSSNLSVFHISETTSMMLDRLVTFVISLSALLQSARKNMFKALKSHQRGSKLYKNRIDGSAEVCCSIADFVKTPMPMFKKVTHHCADSMTMRNSKWYINLATANTISNTNTHIAIVKKLPPFTHTCCVLHGSDKTIRHRRKLQGNLLCKAKADKGYTK